MSVIDIHAHVVAGPEVGAYANSLLAGRGFHGKGHLTVSDESVRRRCDAHIESLKAVGTDVQLISPRPYTMMHSFQPPSIVQWYVEEVNDLIARQVEMYPDNYKGVCGLPQSPSVDPVRWLDELERCIREHNFVGCLLNPDPTEGQGGMPSLGDPMWYPVYDRLCELDVPALIHGAGCTITRESFHNHFITEESIAVTSILRSDVFEHFPNLKLIVAHGGGSVPYQIGRWRALNRSYKDGTIDYDEQLRQLYFDTALYNQESLDLEFKICGTDRCMFGTERPGAGSAFDKDGRSYDDVKPLIDNISWLSESDRHAIYEGTATELFKLS